MRVTIIREDGVVGVGGVFRNVDLSSLYEGVRVIQWNGSEGHVEHDDMTNSKLTSIDAFQPFIDLWTAAALPPPPPDTSAQLIEAAHARINTAYQAAVNALTAGYPEDEIKSWPKQEIEARAWLADNNVATPWIDAAVVARGIAKSELVTKIIANADLFAPAHGQLTGKRQALRDQISALGETPTQEQLDAVQW